MVNTQKRMRGMQVIAIMLAVVLAFAGMIFVVMSSNGASAQAEPTSQAVTTPVLPVVAVVQDTIGGTDAQYPNLISGSAHTVVVKYYLAMPEGYSEAGTGTFSAYVLPKAECTMVVSGEELPAYAPASIAANAAFANVGVNVADYNSGDSELIEIVGEFDFADVIGASLSGQSWVVTNASNYILEATYVIPANAPSGTYDFSFGLDEGESLSFGLPGETPVLFAAEEKSATSFNVYNTVLLPETQDFVYDGEAHLGGLTETDDYTVTGDAQTDAGEDYTAVVSLKNFAIWDLGNGSYSTAAQTLYWDITARPVTLTFSTASYTSVYGDLDEAGILTNVGAIANAGTVIAANGILQADLAGLNISWDVTAGEYDSAAIDVTHAGTGAAFLEEADTGVYTLGITYTADPNYEITATDTATYEITVATPVLEFTAPAQDGTELRKYNGNAVTLGTGSKEINYTYLSDPGVVITTTWYDSEDEVLAGAPVGAGSYKVTVALGATRNYTAASASRTFSIGKQVQTASVTPHNRYFNGLAATIGASDAYDIEVATNATTASQATYTSQVTPLHQGTYEVTVNIPGDANYEAWSDTTSITISAIPVDFEVTLQGVTYRGTEFSGSDLTVTGVSFDSENALLAAYLQNVNSDLAAFNVVSNFTFELDPEDVLAAGSYDDVGVAITAISFSNATFADFAFTGADASVTVAKADLTIDIYQVADDGDTAKNYDTQAVEHAYNNSAKDLSYYAYIAGSEWAVEASRFDAPASLTVTYYNDNAGAIGEEIAAPILPGTYWIVVTLNADTANFNANTTGDARQFVIEPSEVDVILSYVYGENVKYLKYENNALSYVTEATVSVMRAGTAMPTAATLNFFRTAGFGYDLVPFDANAALDPEEANYAPLEISATYTFDVGAGDLNGDKRVTADDAITLRRILARHVSVRNVDIRTELNAWESLASLSAADLAEAGTIIFRKGADVIADGAINAADVTATLEAFATGYGYAIVSDVDISGKKIKAVSVQTVYTYEELVSYVEMGYPVKIADNTDISAATQDFAPTLIGSVAIDLNGNKLTVKSFDLSIADTDVTLKVSNGIIYSVADITISAPNGNVKVADVNGYTYEGHTVTLAAYTSSLHIEEDVAFYVYRVEGYGADAAAFAASIVTDDAVDEISEANITNTDYLIGQKTTKENEKAALEEEKQALIDAGADEAEVNAKIDEINAKGAEITNLEVKKAPVSIPVDTHVVVEEGAKLVVEQITVVEANDQAVSTFSIDVKSAEAEVVKVDISAVKSTEEVNQVTVNYYHVEEVALAGDTSKIEVVSAEDQTVSEITGVKNETELKAALAAKSPVIEIGADFTVTGTISQSANYNVFVDYPVTINGNGFTISFNKRGMWLEGADVVTINDLTLISTAASLGRCINVWEDVSELNLNNVKLKVTGSGNNQVITVGQSGTTVPVAINVNNCVIEANTAGYGIIHFSKVDLTITDSSFTAYAAVYGKAASPGYSGAHGSTATITGSTFTSRNNSTKESASSFAILVDEDAMDYTRPYGYDFTVSDSVFNVYTTNTAKQGVFIGSFLDTFTFDDCTFNLHETLADTAVVTFECNLNSDCEIVETTDAGVITYFHQLVNAYVGDETEIRNALALGATKLKLAYNITLSTSSAAERIAIDHPVELDMNGKTITASEYAFVVMPGGELDIIGEGSINYVGEEHTKGALRVAGSDDVNAAEGKLTLGENVTIESNGYGIVIWHVNYRSYGSNVIVNGTIDSYYAAVCPSGNIKAAAGDVVNGAPIDAVAKVTIGSTARLYTEHEAAIYAAGFANITVEDGAVITGDVSGVEVRGGFFTMNGGTITSNANATYTKANGNGTTGYGVGLIVAQHTTKQAVNVTINGGQITGPVALMQCNPENNSAADIAKITITINGGIFTSALGSVDILPVLSGATEAEAGTIVIVDEDKITYTENVAEGYSVYESADCYAIVRGVGVGTEAEFNAAMAAAEPVVSVVKDITFTGNAPISSNRCTQILNSTTIYGNNKTFYLKNRGIWMDGETVTIRDLNLLNATAGGRCIDTRGGTHTLNIINSSLICTGTSGYIQPLTIGGSHTHTIDVNIVHSTIDAGTSGGATYAIILFNKTNLTMTDSSAGAGWAVFYCKGPDGSVGANGSTIAVEDSEFTCRNIYSTTSNSFGMIVDEDMGYSRGGVAFSATNCVFNVIAEGACEQALFYGTALDTYVFDNCEINLEGEQAVWSFNTDLDDDGTLCDATGAVEYEEEDGTVRTVAEADVLTFAYVMNN